MVIEFKRAKWVRRTVPEGTAEHHLRPNPVLFMFLKVSKMLYNTEVIGLCFNRGKLCYL